MKKFTNTPHTLMALAILVLACLHLTWLPQAMAQDAPPKGEKAEPKKDDAEEQVEPEDEDSAPNEDGEVGGGKQDYGYAKTRKSKGKKVDKNFDFEARKRQKNFEKEVKKTMAGLLWELSDKEHTRLEESREVARSLSRQAAADLPIPESAAFTTLELTGHTAVGAQSGRTLTLSLYTGIDNNGNYQNGAAFDGSPFLLYLGDEYDQAKYRTRYWYRFLARTQFSFGVAAGANTNDESSKVAYGLRFTLLDYGDPRADLSLIGALNDAAESPWGTVTRRKRNEGYDKQQRYFLELREAQHQYDTLYDLRVNEALRLAQIRNSFRTSWTFGYTLSHITRDGRFGVLKDNGGLFWTTFAYGFDMPKGSFGPFLLEKTQILFHFRARYNEDIPDQARKVSPGRTSSFFEANKYIWSLRLRTGTSRVTWDFESAFFFVDPERRNFRKDRYYRISTGFSLNIVKDVWGEFALGGIGGRDVLENEGFFTLTLRWGVAS